MKQIKILSAISFSIVLVALQSCNFSEKSDTQQENREIFMVYTDWSESIAINELSAYLLEHELGYEVKTKLTDVESAYGEVAQGKADVFADAWLPKTQQVYYDKNAEDLDLLGITYPEAKVGFVVPAYSELQKVEDLKKYSDPIIGIDSGAGVMHKARLAQKEYHLQAVLTNGSEQTMIEELQNALKRRKEIVITGWEPHWIFARYELRFLNDPDGLFGEKEKIYTVSKKDFKTEHPVATQFFERMQLTEKQLNTLVYEVYLSEDPLNGVKKWIKKNEYIVNQWVKDLQPERKKIM
jgi:glycine betaine/proline transport system substrate-binding protein